MKSILDPSFRYRSSVATDLKETFARLRRQQRRQQAAKTDRPSAAGNIVNMQPRSAQQS